MIAKHTVGTGYRGLLSYLLRERMAGREGEGVLLGGNMSGRNARELAREFGAFRRLNPDVRRPVFHASLRLPAGETLTDAQWRAAAAEYLERMGYTDAAYVVIKHPERHIHVVASRVRFDGTAVQTWKDRWRGLTAMEAIERRFGLAHPTRPTPAAPGRRVHLKPAEEWMGARGARLPKEMLAERLDRALARSDGSREGFDRALAALGVDARWNIARTGRVSGATFRLLDYRGPLQAAMKGSAIGPAYGWQQLAVRLAARERAYLAGLSNAQLAEAQRQATPPGATSLQEGGALPGGRGGLCTQQPGASPIDAVPARMVLAAQGILAQQGRWNGHLSVDTVLRLTALRLGKEHPEASVATVLAALEAARPGSLAIYPGGQAALAAQLWTAQAAQAHERARAPWEERDYGTR